MCIPLVAAAGTAAAATGLGTSAALWPTIVAAHAPAAAGFLGTGLSLGTVLSATTGLIGAVGQYNASKQQANFARMQADIARQQADDALARGKIEEQRKRREVARMIGKQKATIGSNLVEMDTGSASALIADTAMLGELDALTIRNNAQREAYGYLGRASAKSYEASAMRKKAALDLTGGLLEAATPVASKWYDSKSQLYSG